MASQEVYQKIANAVNGLTTKIDATAPRMPIGIDGAVVDYLLECSLSKRSIPFVPCLSNTVQISSKTNENDELKLVVELMKGAVIKKPVYGLDIRTKTGGLGIMLHNIADDLRHDARDLDFKYVVLFDPNKYADIRASEEELADEERNQLRWFDNPWDSFIQFKKDEWKYNVYPDKLAKLRHVPEIKSLI